MQKQYQFHFLGMGPAKIPIDLLLQRYNYVFSYATNFLVLMDFSNFNGANIGNGLFFWETSLGSQHGNTAPRVRLAIG